MDYKIVEKILAWRLENILPKIIIQDQAEFVKSRYGTDDVVVQCLNTDRNSALIVSLHVVKASD